MTVLVTGAAGYIGSHLMAELALLRIEAIGIDNYSSVTSRSTSKNQDLEVLNVSILDIGSLENVFRSFSITSVVHLAAIKSVDFSNGDSAYLRTNLEGTKILAKLAAEFKVKQFIFSSTAAVYGGNCPIDGFREHAEIQPESSYGRSKALAEEYLQNWAKREKCQLMIFRFFNVAGCTRFGKIETEVSNLIPKIFHNIANRKPTQIFGSDFPTPDGTCIRDYVHVCDIVAAIISGLNKKDLVSFLDPCILNLGSQTGHSVLEVVQTVELVTKKTVSVEHVSPRFGDPIRSIANVELALAKLNFKTRYNVFDAVSSYYDAWKVR